jgi:hypothetical protein
MENITCPQELGQAKIQIHEYCHKTLMGYITCPKELGQAKLQMHEYAMKH